jgi:Xaa-Pro dipeptidase
MDRREFVTVAGSAVVAGRIGGRPDRRIAHPTFARPDQSPHLPSLSPEVFARRLDRLRAELETQELDLFVAAPGTDFEYLTSYNPGRSERLILLLVPRTGDPTIICPSFEVARLRQHSIVSNLRGWEEQENPWAFVKSALRAARPPHHSGQGCIESSLDYGSWLHLAKAAGRDWKWRSGSPVTERLRMIKDPEELVLIRRAVDITETSIVAVFAALTPGVTEQEVAEALTREMRSRGSVGGGLVQFGPSSALPHGGPTGGHLEKEMVVLIDAGCRVGGYTSDITRTIWFGDAPAEEYRKVFNLVHDAQTAAMQLARPFGVRCQDMDRAAREIITTGGYGPNFTHRLGHGLGMDGHEPPYLVEGDETPLEPGMVFTIEPGIYQPDRFGVRIEDDTIVTETGLDVLSHRPQKL